MTRPTLVYDDDCGFCTWCAEWLDDNADVRIVGFSELDDSLRERLPPSYENCAHLLVGEERYSCGASIEESLLRTEYGRFARPLVSKLREYGAYRNAREWAYRRGADNRDILGKFLSKPTRA
ncbi:DCC1-like thiol-disulfide oxidoreductase family protein [Halogeometricum luteum]|uniref:DUF393 domain-containing protein n=1 Tax=Halogeometricum luteum TaxID=2950537 RepID=A0ABU2G048_9EURY|nr:DCC1-like thiol-disulfide oxidoreductase family protein [Halogeometricum sp. S3BR5-2]MDS0294167.1 DUF393 domain-containing protein [Halogeometricum sp. S3BR5-2]